MIRKTFQDLLAGMAKKILVSPLLTPEQEKDKAHANCLKRGYHRYQDGSCQCGAVLKW